MATPKGRGREPKQPDYSSWLDMPKSLGNYGRGDYGSYPKKEELMSVTSTGLLRWVKSEISKDQDAPWHLSFDGRNVECGMASWSGVRPLSRALHTGPPENTCAPCKDAVAVRLGLTE